MSHSLAQVTAVRAVLHAAALFVLFGIAFPGSSIAEERPTRKATRERNVRSSLLTPPAELEVPPMRMRVETPEGVLVIYDAAAPPGGDEGCLGFLAYWRFTADGSN